MTRDMGDVIPIIGLHIELNRASDGVCPGCGSMAAIVGKGAGPHAARLDCANCARFRGWLPALAAEALVDTTRRCGRPTVVIQSSSPEFDFADAKTTTSPDGGVTATLQQKGKRLWL
jgi:hypothetical protein